MAKTKLSNTDEVGGGHYYGVTTSKEVVPCYSIKGKTTGKQRSIRVTDFKEIRENGLKVSHLGKKLTVKRLLPSVTTIMSVLAKPGLENWKINQAILATERIPRPKGVEDKAYIGRVCAAAFAEGRDAAAFGTRVHDCLETICSAEDPYQVELDEDLVPYILPAVEYLGKTKFKITGQEISIANEERGYAGKTDVLFETEDGRKGILDWKTKKTKAGEKVGAYDEYSMQLAAYAAAVYGEDSLDEVLAINAFVSTTEPGRFELVTHKDLRRHYDNFLRLVGVWMYIKKLDVL